MALAGRVRHRAYIFTANAQVIEFESGGLKYQALTKDGLTIMVAPFPPTSAIHRCPGSRFKTAESRRSPSGPKISFIDPESGDEIAAMPARTVVNSLIDRASKGDVIKLINGIRERNLRELAIQVDQRLRAAAAERTSGIHLDPAQSRGGGVGHRSCADQSSVPASLPTAQSSTVLAGKPFATGVVA